MTKLFCVGAGHMVKGLLVPLLKGDPTLSFGAYSPGDGARKICQELGGQWIPSLEGPPIDFDWAILGCKPQNLKEVAPALRQHLRPHHLVASILAATSLRDLEQHLGPGPKARLMPNIPCQVGEGVALATTSPEVSPQQKEKLLRGLSLTGAVFEVSEHDLDLATPFCGSGPAYFWALLEAFEQELKAQGMDPSRARAIGKQTLVGAAMFLKQTDYGPREAKSMVASPKGVTEQALKEFEGPLAQGFSRAIQRALEKIRAF